MKTRSSIKNQKSLAKHLFGEVKNTFSHNFLNQKENTKTTSNEVILFNKDFDSIEEAKQAQKLAAGRLLRMMLDPNYTRSENDFDDVKDVIMSANDYINENS